MFLFMQAVALITNSRRTTITLLDLQVSRPFQIKPEAFTKLGPDGIRLKKLGPIYCCALLITCLAC